MPLLATLRCDSSAHSPGRWRELLVDTRVAGLPLLKRHLLTLAQAGIHEITIVVPPEIIGEIEQAAAAYLRDTPKVALTLKPDGADDPLNPEHPADSLNPERGGDFIRAPKAGSPAEPPCEADIVVEQRADTLVDPRLVAQVVRLIGSQPASFECVDRAGGDRNLKSPYKVGVADSDEARVLTEGFRLQASRLDSQAPARVHEQSAVRASGFDVVAGERLLQDGGSPRLNAVGVDTQEAEAEDAFVPVGLGVRAPGAETAFLDIGRYYWHRFDDRCDGRAATRKVLLATMKATDGIYARTNRRVSLPISRLLIDTPITPNMVTLATLACSALAAWLLSLGHYPAAVAGSLAAWFASMLDGVDGELARARFQASAFGHWLEMVCDYAFYVLLAVGLGLGIRHVTGHDVWLLMGIGCAIGVVVSFSVVAHLKRSYARQGSMGDFYLAYQRTVSGQPNLFLRFTPHLTALMTRAGFPYFLVAFCVLGLRKELLVLFLVCTQSFWIVALYASRLRISLD